MIVVRIRRTGNSEGIPDKSAARRENGRRRRRRGRGTGGGVFKKGKSF